MKDSIWVVDDDQGILEVTEIVLQEAGFKVKGIAEEKLLHQLLLTEEPSLILMDITISGSDGKEVARKLKSNKKTKHIPVILMSADINIEEKARIAGVDGFIKKPFDITDLESIVRGSINK